MAWYLAALVKVHIYPDRRAAEQLAKQYQQNERKAMDRGSIYDGRGEPLALSVTTYSVFLDPGVEGFEPGSLDNLAPYIGKVKVQALGKNWIVAFIGSNVILSAAKQKRS